MFQSVNVTKTDGTLGVAGNTERILAIIAPASGGATNVAYGFTSKDDLVNTFQAGDLVEYGAYALARGIPIVAIRSAATTLGAYGTINSAGKTGTSTVTAGTTKPFGNYDVIVKVANGGTIGTAGITYQYSLDNGVNYTQLAALGTATTMTLDSGVSFALAAGTLITGDTWSVTTTAPASLSSDLTAAYQALYDYASDWLRAMVVNQSDSTLITQGDNFAQSLHTLGKWPEIIMNTRVRNSPTEDRATYQAAMTVVRAGAASLELSVAVDQCEVISEISGRRLRMLACLPYAVRTMIIDDSQDASAFADGPLPNVFITTPAGVRAYHDEFRYPGLDALGFTTLRTWGGRPQPAGAFVNNPRVFSSAGSNFRYFQHTALLNRLIEKTYALLRPRLSIGVLCDSTTGRIRDDVARGIEDAVNAELRTEFSDPGRCSSVKFQLSRTDNILATDTLTFTTNMIPLGYPKQFIGKAGLVKTLATTTTS